MQLTRYHGKRYNVIYYALEMILAVGFRVRGVRGTQFRQWANAHLSEYLVKGFTIDDARLKNPDGRPDYFDELLARIRDIRSSERNFYQKVTDVYATATDYDPRADITREFFATVQNKMHYAVHEHTAAEVVYERVDSDKPNVGMLTFKGDYVTRDDVRIAKNYLTENELSRLNLPVSQFPDFAGKPAKCGRAYGQASTAGLKYAAGPIGISYRI